MIDAWTDRLSEHLDGDLTGEERALLEAHLATCAACTETLAGLSAVVLAARSLPHDEPVADLWPGIEARIAAFARDTRARAEGEARRPGAPAAVRPLPTARRGVALSWPQLLAAGFALVLLSGGAAWYAARNAAPGAPVVARGGDSARAREAAQASAAGVLDHQLAGELDQLERVLADKRGELDPETVRTIENNLKIIDLATTQAREALASDPANPYLKEHLSKTMKQKIDLLREATVLASAQ
jgi:anti-sigma factor RsiW